MSIRENNLFNPTEENYILLVNGILNFSDKLACLGRILIKTRQPVMLSQDANQCVLVELSCKFYSSAHSMNSFQASCCNKSQRACDPQVIDGLHRLILVGPT